MTRSKHHAHVLTNRAALAPIRRNVSAFTQASSSKILGLARFLKPVFTVSYEWSDAIATAMLFADLLSVDGAFPSRGRLGVPAALVMDRLSRGPASPFDRPANTL
jgi:hypothetical protein